MPSESRFDEAKACFQGKIDALHLVRAVSPTHTEVRVFKALLTHAYLRISGPYQAISGLYQTINVPFGGYTKHKEWQKQEKIHNFQQIHTKLFGNLHFIS